MSTGSSWGFAAAARFRIPDLEQFSGTIFSGKYFSVDLTEWKGSPGSEPPISQPQGKLPIQGATYLSPGTLSGGIELALTLDTARPYQWADEDGYSDNVISRKGYEFVFGSPVVLTAGNWHKAVVFFWGNDDTYFSDDESLIYNGRVGLIYDGSLVYNRHAGNGWSWDFGDVALSLEDGDIPFASIMLHGGIEYDFDSFSFIGSDITDLNALIRWSAR